MADYKVLITPAASIDLEKRIPAKTKPAVAEAIRGLGQEPFPAGMKRLHTARGLMRIRIGNYRVLYSVDTPGKSVLIEKIGHRKEVYRFLHR